MSFPMFCLLFLISIVSVLAQGENDCTLYKYATVNTYRTEKSFSFSCYGVGADCEVYYAPLGTGCNGDSLTLIDTVPENETQVLTSDEGFELGGRFCSNNQIGVYYVDDATGYIAAHLPRATEAGTKFHPVLVVSSSPNVDRCVVSALSLRATVRVSGHDEVLELNIDPYTFQQFEAKPFPDTPPGHFFQYPAPIDSDNPVIISCSRSNSNRLATLQPISQEPLVANVGVSNSVSVIISDCSTNKLLQNFSKVNFIYVNEVGSSCDVTQSSLGDPDALTAQENCLFFVEPLEGVCVGMLLLATTGAIISMGVPESKLSTRFANYPDINNANLISFSDTTCTGFFASSHEEQPLLPDWVADDIIGKVSFFSWLNLFADFFWMECENSVLLVSREDRARFPFLSGYQSEELWQPYFDSICPSKPPSSSNARSLVRSLVVFFAVYLFCSSFLV